MFDGNPYEAPKAKVADIAAESPDTTHPNWSAQVQSMLIFVCAVVAAAGLCTGAYGWYSGYSTLLEFENVGTVVALLFCGLGVTLWGPSFSHGSRLSDDGYMPTPATGNPRNKYRGLLLFCGGLFFLGLVILTHYALS